MLQKWGVRLLAFVVYATLGRLLSPGDFGTVAVAAAVIAWSSLLVDFGLPIFLIQAERVSPRTRDTVFWIGMGFAAVMGLVQIAAADLIAGWIGEPEVADVLRVLAVVFPLASIAGIQGAMFKRQLRFRAVALRGIVAVAASGLVAVVLALAGAGVWALVGQTIAFQAASVLALWLADPWRPRLSWDSSVARRALGFGAKSFGSFALDNLNGTADVLIVGHRLDAAAVGNYSMATRLVRVVLDSLVSVVYSVANPLFARAKHDRRLLGDAYTRAVTQAILVSAPALAVLAATFGPVLEIIVGPKWLGAAAVGSLITIAEAIRVPLWFDRSLLYALGRPGAALVLDCVDAVLLVGGVVIGVRWGLVGVGVGLCVRIGVMWPARLIVSCRLAGVGAARLTVREVRLWLAAAVCGGAAWLTLDVSQGLSTLLALALAGLAGLVTYAVLIRAVAWSEGRYAIAALRSVLSRRRAVDDADAGLPVP